MVLRRTVNGRWHRPGWFGALFGGASGLWVGAWLGLAQVAAMRGLFVDVGKLPGPEVARLHVDLFAALSDLLGGTGLGFPPTLAALVALLGGAGAAIGACVALAAHTGRLDPARLALRGIAWATRGLFAWPNWFVVAGLVVVPFAALGVGGDRLEVVAAFAGLPVAAMVAAPFLVCRVSVVSGDRIGPWWRGPWPSAAAVLLCIALAGAEAGSMALLDGLADALPVMLPASLLASVPLAALVWALQAGALLRDDLSPLRSPGMLSWSRFGPWCAFVLLLDLALVLALGPIVAAYLLVWKAVPVVAGVLSSHDMHLPIVVRVGITLAKAVGRYWWLMLGPPAVAGSWLAAGRLGWLQEEAEAAAPAHLAEMADQLKANRAGD